jgi:hypothetical protein
MKQKIHLKNLVICTYIAYEFCIVASALLTLNDKKKLSLDFKSQFVDYSNVLPMS